MEDQVWELLYEITKRLNSKKVSETYRREILDAVLPFIKSRNSGAGDAYEPRLLKKMKGAGRTERMKIHMDRKEYDRVVVILSKYSYPQNKWDSMADVRIAEKLEKRYPEKVLKWYLSGLGDLSSNQKREEYARKAGVMAKVHHMLVEVLKDENRWKKLAVKVKKDNFRRPAFQQEFAQTVPGWESI